MNDIRVRIVTAALLSLAAFFTLYGALFAILWWLAFTKRFRAVPRISLLAGSLLLIAVIAVVLQLLGGAGISYGVRMCAVMLIAAWLWSGYRPGELLHFSVWAFGRRRGFDLGLVAELSMQSFETLLADLDRMRTAWAIKGIPLTPSRLPAAGVFLLRSALRRAEDTGELLAVRGYHGGGTICPVFPAAPSDIIAAAAAVFVCAAAISW